MTLHPITELLPIKDRRTLRSWVIERNDFLRLPKKYIKRTNLLWFVLYIFCELKESLIKSRLTAQHASYLHISRHLVQKFLDRRQPACVISIQSDEKSDCAICALDLISVSLINNVVIKN